MPEDQKTKAPKRRAAPKKRPEDLEALLDRLLHTALRDNLPSIAGRRFSGAAWRCHVEPEEANG